MKGIAVETVLYAVVLVLALVLLTIIFMKVIPAFGQFVTSATAGIKKFICDLMPWYLKILGC
jgi:hypothetical protein